MPYIRKEERESPIIKPIEGVCPASAGQLGYCIAKLIDNFLVYQTHSFETFAKVKGTLELVLDDWQRRFVNGYEDEKLKENGDVY